MIWWILLHFVVGFFVSSSFFGISSYFIYYLPLVFIVNLTRLNNDTEREATVCMGHMYVYVCEQILNSDDATVSFICYHSWTLLIVSRSIFLFTFGISFSEPWTMSVLNVHTTHAFFMIRKCDKTIFFFNVSFSLFFFFFFLSHSASLSQGQIGCNERALSIFILVGFSLDHFLYWNFINKMVLLLSYFCCCCCLSIYEMCHWEGEKNAN